MDWQRNLLISAIVLVLALLYIRWNEFEAERAPPPQSFVKEAVVVPEIDNPGGQASNADGAIPLVGDGEKGDAVATESPASRRLVTVRSDVLEVTIDTYGGDIVRTALLAHRESLDPRSAPSVILNRSRSTIPAARRPTRMSPCPLSGMERRPMPWPPRVPPAGGWSPSAPMCWK